MKSVIEKQELLQRGASNILKKLKLLDFLSKFGSVKVIGSVALGLMTWRDIDIDISVENLREDDYFQIVRYVFDAPGVTRIILSDNRKQTEDLVRQGIPASIYLGIIVKDEEGDEWKMDIRLVESSAVRAEKYVDEVKTRLNDENREIILKIKNTICTHPKYLNKEVGGIDIYNSVLDGKVRSLNDFQAYMLTRGIDL